MSSRAELINRPQIRAKLRALESLVASYLIKTGFEVDKTISICEQLHAELRLSLEEQKAEAVENSAQVSKILRNSIDSLFQAFHVVAGLLGEILDLPILIWQTQGIDFPEIQYEPGHSQAKFVINANSDSCGWEEMSFYFLWQNPSDKVAVINVDSALELNGSCHAQTDGGYYVPFFHPYFEVVELKLGANLYLYEPPFTDPLEPKASDEKIVEHIRAHSLEAPPLLISGIDGAHVRTIAQLHHGPFIVAPHASTLIEVTVSMAFCAISGEVSVDFASGDFHVMCPGVAIRILDPGISQ
jgi:hypothetical protein